MKEHVRTIMGPASVAFSNAMVKMSRLQAAQVCAQLFGIVLHISLQRACMKGTQYVHNRFLRCR